MNLLLKRLTCLAGLAGAALLPGLASAGTLNIIVGNLDVQFSGDSGELFEVDDSDFGNSDETESQSVTSAEFEVDGVTEVLLNNPPDEIFVDLLIPNLGNTIALGSLQEDQGGTGAPEFAFELFTNDGTSLQLAIDSISFVAVDIPIAGTGFFNFFAEAEVISQNLPIGLALAPDVLLSFTATDAAFLGGASSASALLASGALTITGTLVPEPSTACLIGLAFAASGAALMRQRLG